MIFRSDLLEIMIRYAIISKYLYLCDNYMYLPQCKYFCYIVLPMCYLNIDFRQKKGTYVLIVGMNIYFLDSKLLSLIYNSYLSLLRNVKTVQISYKSFDNYFKFSINRTNKFRTSQGTYRNSYKLHWLYQYTYYFDQKKMIRT